jgi:hypothetical protein
VSYARNPQIEELKENRMNLALWIVAGLLAVAYVLGGAAKVIISKEKIASFGSSGRWTEDVGAGTVKAIGVLEVLGGLGLILPAALGIAPILVPLAATGLAIIMVGATIVRVRRSEVKLMVLALIYLALTIFVAWGRFSL